MSKQKVMIILLVCQFIVLSVVCYLYIKKPKLELAMEYRITMFGHYDFEGNEYTYKYNTSHGNHIMFVEPIWIRSFKIEPTKIKGESND